MRTAGPYRYRKIMVPVDEEHRYRAENTDTGEILECSNITPLLKRIAADPLHPWKIEGKLDDEDFLDA